ncbi:hypothetical protein RU639_004476 [Aspergillus parasiticus]
MTANMNKCGLNPRGEVPFSFIFKGPPGSRKTMTARALGKMYYSMGLLPTMEVMDCSATDMIGKYAGQTGPKALGKVLFINEAYRLGFNTYDYPREAVGELKLGKTTAWANARDVGAIAEEVTLQLFMNPLPAGQPMEISLEEIARVLNRFYRNRRSKEEEEEAGHSSES